MAKKQKGSKKIEEKEFDLPEGLDLLETNGWGSKLMTWLKNNFSAIILPIIALIILGGGIYLYSQQKGEGVAINDSDIKSGIVVDLNNSEKTTEKDAITTKVEIPIESTQDTSVNLVKDKTDTPKKEIKNEIVNTSEVTPPTNYKESATYGDGITNLARRALKSYLTAKKITLNPEQKIYAEDYIQNRTGTRMLDTGETLTFSQSLISEAISQSQQLNTTQIENLGQYARLVPSLNY